MGIYLNPPADGFEDILKDGLYVDKTGLITYTNRVMGTSRKLTCFSRPRRFGKSYAAQMLVAFYSKGAEAGHLFEKLRVANPPAGDEATESDRETADYVKYLNKCDVLFWDMTWFLSNAVRKEDVICNLQSAVVKELREAFPDCIDDHVISMPEALLHISAKTGRKFYIIIDEWDALFRETPDDTALQESYINLLRALFKGGQVSRFLCGAYVTGILPIKKYGTQSALTDFREFSMLEPKGLAEYVGFTEREVKALCEEHGLDFAEACSWYDGYKFDRIGHIFSPNSIIEAVVNHSFSNYWTQTETYESLLLYIELNFDGLKDAVLEMLGGNRCRIDTGSFQNDMTSLKNRDNVFTLLVHLGYLAYDAERREVYIPNEEIREEFIRAVKNGGRRELVKSIELSDRLLEATIRMEEDVVAELIGEAHLANTSPQFYHDEQALRSVVIMAYLSCVDHYLRFEEITGGRGYIDILFFPRKTSGKPALLIELKWDKSAEKAVAQIEEKDYVSLLRQADYEGDVLLVGISYNVKKQKHSCRIRKRNLP